MNGILFKPEMIQAIQENRKTQTRRIMKPQPIWERGLLRWQKGEVDINLTDMPDLMRKYAKYHIGQTLYVKEAWKTLDTFDGLKPCELPKDAPIYFAFKLGESEWLSLGKLRSPMFLKEKDARYFIQITDVRPERLQDITSKDCVAEGIDLKQVSMNNTKTAYLALWDSINGKNDHKLNKWVWVYSFKLVAPDK